MKDGRHFYKLLLTEVLQNITNRYDDNYDETRYGKIPFSWKNLIRNVLGKKLNQRGVALVTPSLTRSLAQLSPYLDDISLLYDRLADEESKRLLVQLVAYRILGHEKYKLPLNTPAFWEGVEQVSQWQDKKDCLMVKYCGDLAPIHRYRLEAPNPPLEIYYTPKGIYSHLSVKQYEYMTGQISIKAEQGDVVLDCGACWGDTALFFAHQVKEPGHVYSFEFIPDNIRIFNANINLEQNSRLKDIITLVPFPLGEVSGREISYEEDGPGSRVSGNADAQSKATTICIDDFARQYGLEKVDLIKMDIEGAELPSLKGAVNVIRRFRPKLAISIYHSLDDFTGISQYIDSLNLGYEFYLKHGSTHQEETVLLAIVPGKE